MNRVDIHHHFMPGVDDGCRNLDDVVANARILVAHGYSRAFCTPHFGDTGFTHITNADVVEAVVRVRAAIAEAGIPLEIRPGGELRLSPDLPEILRETGIPTLGHNSKYVLTDLWEEVWPVWATRSIEWLQKQGLTVIIAHPERTPAFGHDPKLIGELSQRGVVFAGNLGPIGRNDGSEPQRLGRRFLQEGRYFILASDGHRPDDLSKRLAGLQKATELVGAKAVEELTVTNPGKLWV